MCYQCVVYLSSVFSITSASSRSTWLCRHVYLPCVRAILHPDSTCCSVPLFPDKGQSGVSDSFHLCRFVWTHTVYHISLASHIPITSTVLVFTLFSPANKIQCFFKFAHHEIKHIKHENYIKKKTKYPQILRSCIVKKYLPLSDSGSSLYSLRLPYRRTWSMLPVFSAVRVAHLLLLLCVYTFSYFVFFVVYVCFLCLVFVPAFF